MPFKSSKRVIYEKNPLVEVVCQLRFPRILTIDEKSPADFQERVREAYPIYNVVEQQLFADASIINAHRIIRDDPVVDHIFESADGKWQINLTSTHLSLMTLEYTRWEEFQERLKEPLKALEEIYRPAFYEYIGLRYVDAYMLSALDLESNTSWSDLIEPFVLGFISDDNIVDKVIGHTATTEIILDEEATARIIATTGHIHNDVSGKYEPAFIIDCDFFYNTRKNRDDVDESLNFLNAQVGNFIRSIVKVKLHNAMKPQEVDE